MATFPDPAHTCLARVLVLLAAGLLAGGNASAAARLRCDVDQGGEQRQFEFAPSADPYAPRPLDIGRHFRFKAVIVGSDTVVEYVKLYTYFQAPRQPVLLQQSTYLAPQPQPESAGAHALTGTIDVHSPELVHQMRYGCALLEVRP